MLVTVTIDLRVRDVAAFRAAAVARARRRTRYGGGQQLSRAASVRLRRDAD
jgi:hypothetical protein